MAMAMANKRTRAQQLIKHLQLVDKPIITLYDLSIIIFKLFYNQIETYEMTPKEFINKRINELIKYNYIYKNKYVKSNSIYNNYGHTPNNIYEIACCIDPFCYISHLSAMDFYGITDKNPENLILTTLSLDKWKNYAENKMKRDLKDYYDLYEQHGLKKLSKITVDKIGKHNVREYRTKNYGRYKNIEDMNVRVATIGRVFLDMIHNQDLCGGIHHVIEVYKEYAKMYKKIILKEIDNYGRKIDKIRAGFILEEICGINDEMIEKWKGLVQRGGSQKLNPSDSYSPNYSETWCISVNI